MTLKTNPSGLTTTTNWEKGYEKIFENYGPPIEGSAYILCTEVKHDELKDFIRTLLAQQRSELLDFVEKSIPRYLKGGELRNQYFVKGYNECRDDVLSALRLSVKNKK